MGPQTRRRIVYHCGLAGAELMSAAASPGRTWTGIVERRLPVVARAAAAAFRRASTGRARLPGLAGAPPAAASRKLEDPGGSGCQPGGERDDDRRMDRDLGAVSVIENG